MSERILLIGATGFLGSFVAARLADGPRPAALLARPTSDLSYLPHRLEVRCGDLADPARLPLDGITTLVYCASMGFGHVPPLIPQLEQHSVRRAVFISTTAIFTSLPSRSKVIRVEAEHAVQRSGLDWTVLRPTMIYGTSRDRNISRLLRFLKRSPMFPICGNGLWQPIHVEDLADAVIAALDSPAAIGQSYNLAGAAPLRFDALVRTAASAVGRGVLLPRVPLELGIAAAKLTRIVSSEQVRRLAEDKAFDSTAAVRDFGFHSRTFEDGVRAEARALGLAKR